ncbi:hypothetical protein MPDQ_003621 [Monascus purpureus]|uniref:DNA polymerase delta subunit 4 n=1 Tax=Monascus purpureus TaxID=5098 RepID=A0A507QMS7_MONPU|nr:hypothetical protein MPDQ_003621 [Monascus purpureus]
MPPTRRRGGNTSTPSRSQSTLSFGSQSRVTKPSTGPVSTARKTKDLEKDSLPVSLITPVEPPTDEKPHIAELVVREQAKAEAQQPLSEEDERAKTITQDDLRKYWGREQAKRRVPRVHQESLSLEEKILRHFDLSSQYGPCIGIARLKRWRRANMLNLNPPIEVLAVLLQDEGDTNQRAYVDELMS